MSRATSQGPSTLTPSEDAPGSSRFGIKSADWALIEATFRAHAPGASNGAVWLFGSRAKGSHRPFSDVDLLVSGPAFPGAVVEAIRNALEESSLPFHCDVVREESLATEYAEEILKSRVKIFDV